MAAPNANTFDLSPPRRPGTDDFNGITKQDDMVEPPDPQTMPNAAEWNTMELLILALARVMQVVGFSVIGGVSPTINSFPCASNLVTAGTFTINRTGAGVVQITWPANTFPPPVMAPLVSLNSGPGMIHALLISNGIEVHTYDQTGAAADRSFSALVF